MTKADLISHICDAAGEQEINLTKKDAGQLVDIMFDKLAEALQQEDRFSYPNFGTFTVKERAEREGRNPRTGDPITIPASKGVNFKPSPSLKERLESDLSSKKKGGGGAKKKP